MTIFGQTWHSYSPTGIKGKRTSYLCAQFRALIWSFILAALCSQTELIENHARLLTFAFSNHFRYCFALVDVVSVFVVNVQCFWEQFEHNSNSMFGAQVLQICNCYIHRFRHTVIRLYYPFALHLYFVYAIRKKTQHTHSLTRSISQSPVSAQTFWFIFDSRYSVVAVAVVCRLLRLYYRFLLCEKRKNCCHAILWRRFAWSQTVHTFSLCMAEKSNFFVLDVVSVLFPKSQPNIKIRMRYRHSDLVFVRWFCTDFSLPR